MIKIIAALTLASIAVTQASTTDNRIYDPTNMTDTQVAAVDIAIMRHFYLSFINGWYSKAKSGVLHIDEQCFGTWIINDMETLDEQLSNLFSTEQAEIQITIDSLVSIFNSLYRLVIKNSEYCRFQIFGVDSFNYILTTFATQNGDQIFLNIQTHAYENIARIMPLMEIFNQRDTI